MALIVLVVNDHLLKGSGLLPNWLTGKLSDFAGLYLAPAVLAVVLQLRSRWGLNLCALATATVFTALQTSQQVVGVWETASVIVGFPWHVTMDPTDLVALPMAVVSARVFSEPVSPMPRFRERLVLVASLVACAASSPPDDGWGSRQSAAPIIVNNSTKHDATVRLQTLRTDLTYDCERLLAEPRESFPRAAFGLVQRFVLQPGQHMFVDELGQAPCLVMLAALDGHSPVLLSWEVDDFPSRSLPRELDGKQLRDIADDSQFITIAFDGENATELVDSSANLLGPFTPRYDVAQRCEVAAEAPELWTPFPLYGAPLLIESRRYGLDGCFELELSAHTVNDATSETPVLPEGTPFAPEPVSDDPTATDDGATAQGAAPANRDAGAPSVPSNDEAVDRDASAASDRDAGALPELDATDAGLSDDDNESDGGRFDGGGSDVEQVTKQVSHRQNLRGLPALQARSLARLGREPERNILRYLSTGSAGQTQPAGGIGGRRLRERHRGWQVPTSEPADLDAVRLRQGDRVSSTTWLCVPEDAFFFEPGETITVQPGTDSLAIVGESGTLTVFRSATLPRGSFPIEIESAAADDCPFSVSEFPAATHRPMAVSFVTPWGRATLSPGQSEWLRSDDFVAMVGLSHSSERILGTQLSNTISGFYAVMEMGE